MERIVQLTDYEYKRLGTLSLLAGIDLLTGLAVPVVSNTHKSSDFIKLLEKFDEMYPTGEIIYAISHDACRKINDHIEQWLDRQIRKRYKFDIDTINKYRDRLSNRWKINAAFLILSSSGWLAAVLTWIL